MSCLICVVCSVCVCIRCRVRVRVRECANELTLSDLEGPVGVRGSHAHPTTSPSTPNPTRAPGKIVYSKWYRNSEHATFTDVFKTFLQEAGAQANADVKVRACVRACGAWI